MNGLIESLEVRDVPDVDATTTPPQVDIAELLKQRRFNPNIEPPPLRVIYTLAGNCISTPGNLTTITSAAKTGKTTGLTAMAAAAMPHSNDADTLGFESTNPKNHALLHFDTEQSPDDHWHCVRRMLERTGLKKPPSWFHSYYLAGLGVKRTWECISEVIRGAADAHGGVHSILIDGVADLVADVNDAGESNLLVSTLHDLAIQNDCPIVGVIHFNPGSEKVRGHLGSQLERKAETNLRLDKEDGVTVIWSEKQRRAPIPKNVGPCFQWSDEAGMHVSVQNIQVSKDELEAQALKELFADMFLDRPSLRYSDLKDTLVTHAKVSRTTAERKIVKAVTFGIVKKSVAGLYVLC